MAVAVGHTESRPAARSQLTVLWESLDELGGGRLHRCVLAHHLADLQDDAADELAWDLRALAAASDGFGDAGFDVREFAASLQLNVADAYRRLGDVASARTHAALALAACDDLDDDGYGRMIRAGVARLAERIDAVDPARPRG
ncbi:hypothetical protein E1212_03545 [Jiangella ureilytica]|uniref:Tetratricopeptide repeat protein n=1 Tax=Jiangella ureilytica TaxID=2530374 RepID=A0A4R4RZN7_9ACTN|nr:hypothetical protein [Jiangella ureilytica]TDC54213.1 hypothetical protein E1212_03545 [Jiangella ureilytica]